MKPARGFSPGPDAVIVGAGLIGLATAAAIAEQGLNVHLLGESRPGEASMAAAGLLAPSVEEMAAGRIFGIAARDRYPSYLEWLRERSGVRVPLNRDGVLQVALNDEELDALREEHGSGEPLHQQAVSALEPALSHAAGAVYFELDGAVDNVALMEGLGRVVRNDPRITFEHTAVDTIVPRASSVQTSGGSNISAAFVIIAAGAWTTRLQGLPRPLPVEPVRGQMIAMHASALSRAVFGAGIYLVPRQANLTLVGSTMEHAEFDPSTTTTGLASLRAAAARLCPGILSSESDSWAGLRPMTPDLLPILGPDPDYPSLLYACGHSRNGILMGPLTADCLVRMVTGRDPEHDLSPFSVARFREPIPA